MSENRLFLIGEEKGKNDPESTGRSPPKVNHF